MFRWIPALLDRLFPDQGVAERNRAEAHERNAAAWQRLVDELQQTSEARGIELDLLSSRLADIEERLGRLAAEHRTLKSVHEREHAEADELRRENAELRERVSCLEEKVARLEAEKAALKQQIEGGG